MYQLGAGRITGAELAWVTRTGDIGPVDSGWQFNPPAQDYGWSLSLDGAHVALTHEVDGNADIWIKQLPNGPFERLTFDPREENSPAWTPDGRFVSYTGG